MNNFDDYRGIRSSMPEPGQRSFFITLSFFYNPKEVEQQTLWSLSLAKWLKTLDSDLFELIRVARKDFEACSLRIYTGDPEEELEEALECLEPQEATWIGYLNINRSYKLKDTDPLPETKDEWDELVGEFAPSEDVLRLFNYIETKYLHCSDLPKST